MDANGLRSSFQTFGRWQNKIHLGYRRRRCRGIDYRACIRMAIPTESGQGDPASTAGNIQSVDSKIVTH